MKFSLGGLSASKQTEYDVIVIGAGIGGLTAAMYATRAGAKTLVLEKNAVPGGALTLTYAIENYPGFKFIEGKKLAELVAEQASHWGATISYLEEAKEVKLEGDYKIVKTLKGTYKAKAIIVATGATPRKLGVPGEDKFFGKGVSTCAICDAPFFKDKVVAIVGGGNTAFDEGDYILRYVKKAYFIHRRDKFRADKVLVERVKKNPKAEFILNSVVEEIIGDESVKKIRIRNLQTNETMELEVDGVFIFIGYEPNSKIVEQYVETKNGYIVTDERMETKTKGIFAVGDVRWGSLKQAVISAGEGATAGYYAAQEVLE
ncbi:MAG: thioredoxin-disulfide reductase [Candidatus Micrarchaeota archaeon]|nr:thioredoxin-disulfide reductase [Candidatus Micrarchaeota archaeon]